VLLDVGADACKGMLDIGAASYGQAVKDGRIVAPTE
jgi:hypothetical protein